MEHKPTTELVTPVDVVRLDQFNRQVVVAPAGTVPPSWVELTAEEHDALIEPPEPPPDGHMTAIHGGFTLQNVTVGKYEKDR